MTLHLEDREIDELTDRLVRLRRVSKTEVVRSALRQEMLRVSGSVETPRQDVEGRVADAMEIVRRLGARDGRGPAADRGFIDSLYEG